MKKLKVSHTGRKLGLKLAFLCLFLCFGIFTRPEESSNAVSPIIEIMVSLDKWTDYFYSYRKLDRFTNPETGKKVTKWDIKISMMAIGKWESNLSPAKITDEPTVKGSSYGTYCILSTTAKGTGRWDGKDLKDLLKVDKNTEIAVCYFVDKVCQYKGDIGKSLCAYNAGKYRISRKTGLVRNIYYFENVTRIINDLKTNYKNIPQSIN